jgi:hypothetical protein
LIQAIGKGLRNLAFRRPGRDCPDPDCMDANTGVPIFSEWLPFHGVWIPSFPPE